VVALGDESFRLDAGSLTRSRNGKVFRYQAPHDARGIRSFRIARRASGIYLVSFTLTGVDLRSSSSATRCANPWRSSWATTTASRAPT